MRSALLLSLLLSGCSASGPEPLRVCADPNNLPFSNRRGEGFENKLAELIGAELGRPVAYTWWAQRRGSIRETLNAGRCDLIPGTAAGLEMLATTEPYYASTYVAVTRAGEPPIESFDDRRLPTMRIGVQMIGDDFSNTPPAHALTRRGIVENVRGYMVYGDYAHADPQARIVNAVAKGEIDVAFVWGPVGGYFANRQSRPLHVQPITSDQKERLVFAIAMGTRRKEQGLQTDLNRLLRENHAKITGLLARFNVPMTALPEASAEKAD